MQSLQGLSSSDFKEKVSQPVSKLEIYHDEDKEWKNLCALGGKNYLISIDYSSGQKELGYKPVAASITIELDDTDGDLNPKCESGLYTDYLKVGRKIRFYTGLYTNDTEYFWQQFIGVIEEITVNRKEETITIRGSDYTQRLIETKLLGSDSYWGTSTTKSTVDGQTEYELPADCKGVYLVYLDGEPIYDQDYWTYDYSSNKLYFFPSKAPGNGTDNLVIYYFITQNVEDVVADILVTAGIHEKVSNSNFENWSDGPASNPDDWETWSSGDSHSIAREGTITKYGSYSAKLTRAGEDASIFQDIHATKGISYWQGKIITLSAWVYATVANRVRLRIGDGVGVAYSNYHTGDSTWQLLSVSAEIDSSATRVRCGGWISGGDTSGYFDGLTVVKGDVSIPYLDYTVTGVTIDRVRFNSGVSALYAIQKLCERVNYQFFFKYDGTPYFKAVP